MLLLTAIPCFFPHPRRVICRVAGARLPRRLRGQSLLGRHRLELGVDAEGARQGFCARRLRRRQCRASVTAPASPLPGHPSPARSATPDSGSSRAAGGSSPRSTPSGSSSMALLVRHRPAPRQDGRAGQINPPTLVPPSTFASGGSASTTRPSSRAYVALSAWLPSTTSITSASNSKTAPAHGDLHLPGLAAAARRNWFSRPLPGSPRHVLDLRRHAPRHRYPDDAQRSHRHRPRRRVTRATTFGYHISLLSSPSSSSCSAAGIGSSRCPNTFRHHRDNVGLVRRPRRDVRRPRRLLPAAAVRLLQTVSGFPDQHLLRPLPADRGLRV